MTTSWRNHPTRIGFALALILAIVGLAGLASLAHSHDGGVAPAHCEACRWANEAAPVVVVLLALIPTLPEVGAIHVPAPASCDPASRRRPRTRGPPLV